MPGSGYPGKAALTATARDALALLALASPAPAFIYWGNFAQGSIGRAENDGSAANPAFITGAGSVAFRRCRRRSHLLGQ